MNNTMKSTRTGLLLLKGCLTSLLRVHELAKAVFVPRLFVFLGGLGFRGLGFRAWGLGFRGLGRRV